MKTAFIELPLIVMTFSRLIAGVRSELAQKMLILSANTTYNYRIVGDFRLEIHPNMENFDFVFSVPRNFIQEPWISMYVYMKDPNVESYRLLVQSTVNLCELWKKKVFTFGVIFLKDRWRRKNMLKNCALVKGLYFKQGMKLTDLVVAEFFSGTYKVFVDLYFLNGGEEQFIGNASLLLELD